MIAHMLTLPSGMLRLGLVVSLLVLAVDPFAQQLVQFEQRVTNTEAKDGLVNVTVPRAERYARGTEYTNGELIPVGTLYVT